MHIIIDNYRDYIDNYCKPGKVVVVFFCFFYTVSSLGTQEIATNWCMPLLILTIYHG